MNTGVGPSLGMMVRFRAKLVQGDGSSARRVTIRSVDYLMHAPYTREWVPMNYFY